METLDPEAFERGIRDVVGRSHNLPPDLLRDAVGQYVSDTFDAATAKCHHYLLGSQILGREDAGVADGWFNAVSLGNWLMIAHEVGVPAVPARMIFAGPTLAIYSLLAGTRLSP